MNTATVTVPTVVGHVADACLPSAGSIREPGRFAVEQDFPLVSAGITWAKREERRREGEEEGRTGREHNIHP